MHVWNVNRRAWKCRAWMLLVVALLVACGGSEDPSAPATTPPVANAGTVQNVLAGSVVTLDGSASTASGGTLAYRWTLTSRPAGSAAALSSSAVPRPTFTADVAGNYVASLVVNDGRSDSAAATVTVTASVANAAPVARAGTAQNVTTGALVTLDGTASSDANGDALTYRWTLASRPAGSVAVLALSTSVHPTFTADAAGTYTASLIVNDGQVDSAPATVSIVATVANAAPVANAGATQDVATGHAVTLDGSASSDANGDPLTYRWTLTSRPAGSAAVLASSATSQPTFTPDVAGAYVATLVVNDGQVDSAAAAAVVNATVPSVTLERYSLSPTFVPIWTPQPFPFTGSRTGTINACGGQCNATVFRLNVGAGNYAVTVSNVSAVNLATGAPAPGFNVVDHSFYNGRTLYSGTTTDVALFFGPQPAGQTVSYRFQFTIVETGQTFDWTETWTTF